MAGKYKLGVNTCNEAVLTLIYEAMLIARSAANCRAQYSYKEKFIYMHWFMVTQKRLPISMIFVPYDCADPILRDHYIGWQVRRSHILNHA